VFTVHDSCAKLPPGLLNGNVNQYGDIDQCLNVRSSWEGGVIKGRYCLTTMALSLSDPDNPLLRHFKQLLFSHGLLRSKLDDVSVHVPINSLQMTSKAISEYHTNVTVQND
jgi:hypothetical protein